jgi:hypothetical protein
MGLDILEGSGSWYAAQSWWFKLNRSMEVSKIKGFRVWAS